MIAPDDQRWGFNPVFCVPDERDLCFRNEMVLRNRLPETSRTIPRTAYSKAKMYMADSSFSFSVIYFLQGYA